MWGIVTLQSRSAAHIQVSPLLFQTCACDIFAAGCVIFFVISGGGHPFDPPLHRQANILNDRKPARQLEDSEDCELVIFEFEEL